ncbi:hypothetical protein D9M70_456300 [compost metagenome]
MGIVQQQRIAQRAADALGVVDVALVEADPRQRCVLRHAAVVRGIDARDHAFGAQRLRIAGRVVLLVVAALGEQRRHRHLLAQRRQGVGGRGGDGAQARRHVFDAGADGDRLALDIEHHLAGAVGGRRRLHRRGHLHARLQRQHVDVVLEGLLAQRAVLLQLLADGAQAAFHRAGLAGHRDARHVAFHHRDQHVAVGEVLRRHEGERQRVALVLVHLRHGVGRLEQLRDRDLAVRQRRELCGHLGERQRLHALDAEAPRRQARFQQFLQR